MTYVKKLRMTKIIDFSMRDGLTKSIAIYASITVAMELCTADMCIGYASLM